MKINVKRIPAGGEDLCGEEPAAMMELREEDVAFEEPVRYALHAQIQNNALLVTGWLATPVTLRCSRCLKQFQQRIQVGRFVVHHELSGEDFVDLTAQMREDIILELPQRALCEEACKGLCASCGADLNVERCQCQPTGGRMEWHALDGLKLK
jgi:uncharacterized protein